EGRFEQAASILRGLARESPSMLDAREGLARVLREAGRPAEAFDALLEADRLSPGTPQILLGLADLALRQGDIPPARTYAQAAARPARRRRWRRSRWRPATRLKLAAWRGPACRRTSVPAPAGFCWRPSRNRPAT